MRRVLIELDRKAYLDEFSSTLRIIIMVKMEYDSDVFQRSVTSVNSAFLGRVFFAHHASRFPMTIYKYLVRSGKQMLKRYTLFSDRISTFIESELDNTSTSVFVEYFYKKKATTHRADLVHPILL